MLLHLPTAITDSHFNLFAGLSPIRKDTTPHVHVHFAKRQFAEAPASLTLARLSISPPDRTDRIYSAGPME